MDNYNLDKPLINLASQSGNGSFTARMAVEGCGIFGGIGSGKTSGFGRMLALKYLSAGWGGLVLTVKADEKVMWQEFCHMTGRTDDLLVIEHGGKHFFNFLDYETAISDGRESLTDNVVEVLKTVMRAGQEQSGGKSDDPFWEQALDMLLFNVIDLCRLAHGEVTVVRMFDIVQTIPKNMESFQNHDGTNERKPFHQAFEAARQTVTRQINSWQETLSDADTERMADDAVYEAALLAAVPDARLFKQLDQFFVDTFIPLSDKTRSIIDFTFAGFLFRLLRDPVNSLFCRNTSTLTPEDSLRGKIILINLPVKRYQKVGRDVQLLFKYIWQRAMEKRDIHANGRPVFLWADEAQHFIHEKDAEFQATARSSRVATVYISQNMPNYLASMGGQKAEYRVKSFMGTLGCKIFHANADPETNEYASKLIGDDYYEDHNESITVSETFAKTRGRSRKLERVIRAEEFVRLKTGGPLNNFRVEAYWHRQGDSFSNGQNHLRVACNQKFVIQSSTAMS